MALRAILVHTAIAQQDLPQNTNVSAGQAVYVYEPDGATLLGQAMYAAADGGAPLLQPVFADNLGVLTVYAERAQSVVLKANNVSYQSAFTPWPQVPFWYEDVRAYGARAGSTNPADDDYDPSLPASTPFDNRLAIQEAIDVVVARYGGTVMIPELYHIAGAPIVVNTNRVPNVAVDLLGTSRWRSGLIQETAGVDVVALGKNDDIANTYPSSADSCSVQNMKLQGGRRAVSLNNALNGHFSKLILDRNECGIYAMGQNENHDVEDIFFTAQSQYGMDLGELNSPANGGSGPADANQEIQKCSFRKLRFQIPTTAVNSIKVTGGLGVSGNLEFDAITLEGGPGNLVSLDHCFQAIFSRVTTEQVAPMVPGVSSAFHQGFGCQRLVIRDSLLEAADNHGNQWKYVIEQTDGRLFLEEVSFGGGPSGVNTASGGTIYLNGLGALIIGGGVSANTEIVCASAAARTNTLVINTEDIDTAIPITTWDDVTNGLPFIASNATGLQVSRAIRYGQQQVANQTALRGILVGGTSLLLGTAASRIVSQVTVADDATGQLATFSINGATGTFTIISDPGSILQLKPPGVATRWSLVVTGGAYYLVNDWGNASTSHGYYLSRVDFG